MNDVEVTIKVFEPEINVIDFTSVEAREKNVVNKFRILARGMEISRPAIWGHGSLQDVTFGRHGQNGINYSRRLHRYEINCDRTTIGKFAGDIHYPGKMLNDRKSRKGVFLPAATATTEI